MAGDRTADHVSAIVARGGSVGGRMLKGAGDELFVAGPPFGSIVRYHADALLNGLQFDRHGEEVAAATFAKSLKEAAAEFLEDPLGLPQIPNWNRVLAAMPEFLDLLEEVARKDEALADAKV